MSVGDWILVVGASTLTVYGLLNAIVPSVTVRWQRRSTEWARQRWGGRGALIGDSFADLVGADQLEPWNDPSVRRRVRLLGLAEIVIGSVVVGGIIGVGGVLP